MASVFDRLMNTIRPHLPGAIDEAIRQELFMVCDEFFRRSTSWREEIDFTVAANQKTADIMPTAGYITQLLYATTEGRGIRGATLPQVGDVSVISLPHAPNAATAYKATVAITVSDPVTRDAYPIVPVDLVKRYMPDLINGILARMMAQPSKPYTNVGMAQFYMTKFNGGISRARNNANEGSTKGSQNWTFPQTFSTIRRS